MIGIIFSACTVPEVSAADTKIFAQDISSDGSEYISIKVSVTVSSLVGMAYVGIYFDDRYVSYKDIASSNETVREAANSTGSLKWIIYNTGSDDSSLFATVRFKKLTDEDITLDFRCELIEYVLTDKTSVSCGDTCTLTVSTAPKLRSEPSRSKASDPYSDTDGSRQSQSSDKATKSSKNKVPDTEPVYSSVSSDGELNELSEAESIGTASREYVLKESDMPVTQDMVIIGVGALILLGATVFILLRLLSEKRNK